MYKFDFKETFPCPPEEFIRRTMYHFDEYVKFSPNVVKVDVLSRENLDDGREKITVRVFAKGWLPPVVMKIFKQEDVNWKEYYTVDMKSLTVDWKVETPMFSEYCDCGGTSSARAIHGGCELILTGAMKIGAPPVPGIPKSVVSSVFRTIEPFIGKLVTLNLQKYFVNVKRCIEKERAAKRG